MDMLISFGVLLASGLAAAPTPPLADLLSVADARGSPGDTVDYALTERGGAAVVIRAGIVSEPDRTTGAGRRWVELVLLGRGVGVRVALEGEEPGPEMLLGPDVFALPRSRSVVPTRCGSHSTTGCRASPPDRNSAGETVVQTPAGTFRARRVERRLADGSRVVLFTSSRVPVFGIVRAKLPRARELTLVRTGHDGSSMFPKGHTLRRWPYSGPGPVGDLAWQLFGR